MACNIIDLEVFFLFYGNLNLSPKIPQKGVTIIYFVEGRSARKLRSMLVRKEQAKTLGKEKNETLPTQHSCLATVCVLKRLRVVHVQSRK